MSGRNFQNSDVLQSDPFMTAMIYERTESQEKIEIDCASSGLSLTGYSDPCVNKPHRDMKKIGNMQIQAGSSTSGSQLGLDFVEPDNCRLQFCYR